LQGRKPPGPS